MTRARIRDLGITIGSFSTGQLNAITDVPGVWVGQTTVIHDQPSIARTGVTVIIPRAGRIRDDFPFAGYYAFNGCGEMTGVAWIEESGMLMSPIALTNSAEVGMVRDAIIQYAVERLGARSYWLPVAAETYDGWLNDIASRPVTKEHVYQAIEAAGPGPVVEGNVGGGTGNLCHDFKGGIGTASRLVDTPSGRFTIGTLVQANYGDRALLRVDGVPVGREIGFDKVPSAWTVSPYSSSILIIVATDAPLVSNQCRQLARRATVGLARVGGTGHMSSGDLFLAFATGNHCPPGQEQPYALRMLPLDQMDPLYDATAEAVEEAILNALTCAETMTGYQGHVAYALPLDELQKVMARYRPKT